MMNNPGFKRGMYFGGAAIAAYLLGYLINKELLFIPGTWPVTGLILPILFMVFAARDTRDLQDGFMSFSEALSSTFLTFVIGSLIFSLFKYIMTSIIDPSLLDTAAEVALERMDDLSGFFSEDQIDMMKDNLEEGGEVKISDTLMAWALLLIFPGFFYSLIISAITKRNAVA